MPQRVDSTRNERTAHRLTSDDNRTDAAADRWGAGRGVPSIVRPGDRLGIYPHAKGGIVTRTASRTARLCDHIDDADDAFVQVIHVVCSAIEDSSITASERREIFSALHGCRRSLRLVAIDGQQVNAATSMLKAIAHTMELTPDVARKLRDSARDLERVDNLASFDEATELFPKIAA